jgi:polysaccharide export outer membrane protein
MYIFKRATFLLILFLLFMNNCVMLPGIKDSPQKKNPNKKLQTNEYSINDVKINIIKINKLSEDEILEYSKNQTNDYKNQVKDYSEIYDYKYEYILGTSDSISLNLTDTDDLDGVYKIDQEGMIDLPFIGKIKLNNLTLYESQNLLIQTIKSFYKNPDLQITIEEFNSNKVYVVGAVRNQITISLNQQPLTLIEAAIQANFNPNAADKLYGTGGLLRREGKVYKIDLTNTFKNKDEKENFYLRKDDVIFINKNSNSIHVFGEVTKPGTYYQDMNYSLTELVSLVGINQLTANAKKVYVIREKFESFLEVDVFQLDIRNPVNLIVGKNFKIKKGDIIFIPPAPIVKWNRTISLLLPQTNLFKSYNPIINNGLRTYQEP